MVGVDAARGRDLSRSWARWRSVAVVVAAGSFLVSGLARVDGARMSSASWARLVVFVVLVAVASALAVLAVRSPPTAGATALRDPRGLGVDGPAHRRVRRALREGSFLDAEDRHWALARARARLARSGSARREPVPVGERCGSLLPLAWMPALWLWTPPSFAAPVWDGWSWGALAGLIIMVVGVQFEYAGRLPGARRREARTRQRIAVLENLPTAGSSGRAG